MNKGVVGVRRKLEQGKKLTMNIYIYKFTGIKSSGESEKTTSTSFNIIINICSEELKHRKSANLQLIDWWHSWEKVLSCKGAIVHS